MLAPNGKPTKLTERQWLQVRTPSFKKWFGDWEKNARIEKLRKAKTVELTGYTGQYELNRNAARAWLKENLEGKEMTIADTGEVVHIGKTGRNKITSHSFTDEAHLKSLASIEQMLAGATFISGQENEKGERGNYPNYRYYVAGVKIDGVDYTAKIVIGVASDGSLYYDHSLTQFEKGVLLKATNVEGTTVSRKQHTPDGVKDKKLLSLLQEENASKVIDEETGEPLVVYHGTEADFTVFDRTKTRANMDIQGMFFSPEKDDAGGYGKNVRAFFLDIRTPADEGRGYSALNKFKGQNGAGISARELLREGGFDGVNNHGEEYIVFEPNQIKSATDNVGAFDAANPDIRYSRESGLNALDNSGNSILTITQDEYTDEFRRIQKESLGLLQGTVSKFHRGLRELTENEQRLLADTYGRLLSGGRGARTGEWVNLTSSKTGNTLRVRQVNGQLFHDIFEINRKYLRNGELVDLHDDYSNAKCFLTDDGLQGFAIEENGNAVSLFSLNPAKLPGKQGFLYAVGDFIRANGGTHLDAYASPNQNLEAIYKKTLGFKTAARMDYNMEFDHDDIAKNHGKPSIVFMVSAAGEVEERHFGKDDYDAAQAYQLEQVEKARGERESGSAADNLDVRYHRESNETAPRAPSRAQRQQRTLHEATRDLVPRENAISEEDYRDYVGNAAVRVATDGSLYYDHSLTQFEKKKLADIANRPANGFIASGDISVTPSFAEVRDKRLLSLLQTENASARKQFFFATKKRTNVRFYSWKIFAGA